MGSKERREREKLELRSRILDAAREMFVTEGFAAVTMRSLAQRIEYSPTAIYLHFKDKEALLAELCTIDLLAMHEALLPIAEGTSDPVARMPALAKAYVRFALEHKAQYQLVFMMPRPAQHAIGPDGGLTDPERVAYASLRDNWQELIDSGLLRPDLKDPDVLAQIWFCGLHGITAAAIAMEMCTSGEWLSPEKQAEAFSDALFRGLLKDPLTLSKGQ